MPATTPAQQRLMGQAYAVKKGDLKPADLNPEYKDQILKIAASMTLKQLKDFAETKHNEMKKESIQLKSFTEFINESKEFESLLEGDVNYKSDKYALVLTGGSIGAQKSFPIFVSGMWASITETGNDKDSLVEKKKRMNKILSPGEKKYYGMSYKVIELTPAKIKEVDSLIAKRDSAPEEVEVTESEVITFVTESKQEQIKKEAISRLSDFFRVPANHLTKFKFDGTDSIKDLTTALNSTSDKGTELYYNTAIKLAKEEVGVDESIENN